MNSQSVIAESFANHRRGSSHATPEPLVTLAGDVMNRSGTASNTTICATVTTFPDQRARKSTTRRLGIAFATTNPTAVMMSRNRKAK